MLLLFQLTKERLNTNGNLMQNSYRKRPGEGLEKMEAYI
jgi:hypothetical protein